MARGGHVASFIGHSPGRALFVGIYSIGRSRPLTLEEFWRVPAFVEMKKFGLRDSPPTTGDRRSSGLTWV